MNYKEEFRKFAIRHGFNHRVYIDSTTFVHVRNSMGCFSTSDMWAVYETDESGNEQNVKFHCSEFLAYCDLASRLGYDFKPII